MHDNNFSARFKFSLRGIITNFPFRRTRQKHAIEHAPTQSNSPILFVSPITLDPITLTLKKSYRSIPRIQGWNWININRVTISPLVFLHRSVESIADVHQSRFSTRQLRFTTVLLHTGSDTANTWKSCNASQQVSRPDKAKRSVDYERRQLVRASRPILQPFVSSIPHFDAPPSCETFVTLSLGEKLWIDRITDGPYVTTMFSSWLLYLSRKYLIVSRFINFTNNPVLT